MITVAGLLKMHFLSRFSGVGIQWKESLLTCGLRLESERDV